MIAERVAALGTVLHIGHKARESSVTRTNARTPKVTAENYLQMTLDVPYLMDGSEQPPHLVGKRMPVNDWGAPYQNPAQEQSRTE